MSEANWTPGPWRADWDDNGQWYIEPLAITGRALRGDNGDCIERSNAHLIAAAPELYEALEKIPAILRTTAVTIEMWSKSRMISCDRSDAMESAAGILRAVEAEIVPVLAKARGEAK